VRVVGADTAGSGAAVPAPRGEQAGAATEEQPSSLPITAPGGSSSAAGGGRGVNGGGMPAAAPPANELSTLTIWIAGDSTVANGNTPCPRGWGGVFESYFDERVTVNNLAAGGRSVNTWLYEVQPVMDQSGECTLSRDASGAPVLQARWQTMLDGMKAGDYLFIQFGINDGDPTCDRHVGLEAFRASYAMMALAARERGAHPVFLTPASSVSCTGNTARGTRGAFVPATLETGLELDVPLIDLHERSVALYQSLAFCPIAGGDVSASTGGPVGDFFCDDHTHFSGQGAVQIAELVVQGLRDQDSPLAAYLR
jgi:lysophospholipase L1-like esterase